MEPRHTRVHPRRWPINATLAPRPLSSHPPSDEERSPSTTPQPNRRPTPVPWGAPLPRPSPDQRKTWASIPNTNKNINYSNANSYASLDASPVSRASTPRSLVAGLTEIQDHPQQSSPLNQSTEMGPKRPIGTIYDRTLSRTSSAEDLFAGFDFDGVQSWEKRYQEKVREQEHAQRQPEESEVRTSRWVEDFPSTITTTTAHSKSIPRDLLPSTHQRAVSAASPATTLQSTSPSPLASTSSPPPPPPSLTPHPTHTTTTTIQTAPNPDYTSTPRISLSNFRSPSPLRTIGPVTVKYGPIRSDILHGNENENGMGNEKGDCGCGCECDRCLGMERRWGKWWMWLLLAFVMCWGFFAVGCAWGVHRGAGECKADGK